MRYFLTGYSKACSGPAVLGSIEVAPRATGSVPGRVESEAADCCFPLRPGWPRRKHCAPMKITSEAPPIIENKRKQASIFISSYLFTG